MPDVANFKTLDVLAPEVLAPHVATCVTQVNTPIAMPVEDKSKGGRVNKQSVGTQVSACEEVKTRGVSNIIKVLEANRTQPVTAPYMSPSFAPDISDILALIEET